MDTRKSRVLLYGILFCLTFLLARGALNTVQPEPKKIPDKTPVVTPSVPNTPTKGAKETAIRLLIPSIRVDAQIEPVGVLATGEMETPVRNPWTGVGLYNAGPLPGEQGSAVIGGHLDRPGGAPAVFWNLRNIHVGDEVQVVMSTGKTRVFHVSRIVYYAPKEAPLQQIFGDAGGRYLNLVTCAGYWIPSEQQTSLRIVIFTSFG
jgi:LPXTG-site transpeptidase (sortase) family protein